jgi:tetratricopeptide (TPR) repeat protein
MGQGEIKMKKRKWFCLFAAPCLSHFLLVGALLPQKVYGQTEFRVPVDPPKACYQIDVGLDLTKNVLRGAEIIRLRNDSSVPLSVIAIDWSTSSSQVLNISVKGRLLHYLNNEKGLPSSTPFFYQLLEPLKPGGEIELQTKFELALAGDLKVIPLSGSWHPRMWWEEIPTQDSYKVRIEAPQGYEMAISGRLNKESGYYENDGVATSFGIYLAADLIKEEKETEGVLITSLFRKDGEECGRFCLEKATEIVKYFIKWLGFYPSKYLYIIPGASRPMGGYPFASGIVVIHGEEQFKTMPPLHWEWITAHEIGHQYWGEYVMSDDYPYGYTSTWLMIGMGICTDQGYTRFRNMSNEKHLAFLNRYLDGVTKQYDTTEDAPPSLRKKQNYDQNNILIHGKGFSILSALESVLGKETFERVFKTCLKEYGGKRLGYRQFWKVCQKVSGQNLDWFFEQWVRSNKYLCYQVVSQESRKEGEKYISHIRVEANFDSIMMPIPVKAVFDDGTSQVKITDRFCKVNNISFESSTKLKEVILDPENQLALQKTPLPISPEELPDMITSLPWQGAGSDAARVFKLAEGTKMTNVDLWLYLGIKLVDGGYYPEALTSFRRITEGSRDNEWNFYALIWMGHLKDLAGEREQALSYYKEALKCETCLGGMSHSQWGIRLDRKWVEERLQTPFSFKQK